MAISLVSVRQAVLNEDGRIIRWFATATDIEIASKPNTG